jgi:hypothetical protein
MDIHYTWLNNDNSYNTPSQNPLLDLLGDDYELVIRKRRDNPNSRIIPLSPFITFPSGTPHPCDACTNNPKNNRFASGVCNCALPALLGY